MEVVLYRPEIPQNTGNIVRTCALTGVSLSLVRPLGFSLSTRHLKRAGLGYWNEVKISCVDSIEQMLQPGRSFYFFSSKAQKRYTDVTYTQEDVLIFGSETAGLPEELWDLWPERFLTIPMKPGGRCLNLSNSVSIVLYEAMRQKNFEF